MLAAVQEHAPELAAGVVAARVSGPPRVLPLLAAAGFALLWVALAAGNPTTTYHFAPPAAGPRPWRACSPRPAVPGSAGGWRAELARRGGR